MAQTVQKGRKVVASGSKRKQADASSEPSSPVPAKKTKTATARKSTGGHPPNRKGKAVVASAAPRAEQGKWSYESQLVSV